MAEATLKTQHIEQPPAPTPPPKRYKDGVFLNLSHEEAATLAAMLAKFASAAACSIYLALRRAGYVYTAGAARVVFDNLDGRLKTRQGFPPLPREELP